MRHILISLLAACVAASFTAPVLADPHKHGHGHGRHKHGHHKEEFWDGHCRVERKLDKKGRYKEERTCHGHAGPGPQPAPVYSAAPAPGVYVQPPSIVLQPPAVVIR